MAITQTDLDALDRAIADGRGARTITFEGQSVTFNSIAEMIELRAFMKREVNSTPTYRLAATDKGT